MVQALLSSQEVGQLPGGSQVSPGSRTSLPQLAEQSSSLVALQPAGQHPSALSQLVMGVAAQVALQAAADPVKMSVVQAFPSSQVAAQESGGSQVSPRSSTPSPQLAEQSLSVLSSQPAAQQRSSSVHSTTALCAQVTSHDSALPLMRSSVHALPSSQSVGQLPGGSQVSAKPSRPSPQNPVARAPAEPSICDVLGPSDSVTNPVQPMIARQHRIGSTRVTRLLPPKDHPSIIIPNPLLPRLQPSAKSCVFSTQMPIHREAHLKPLQ